MVVQCATAAGLGEDRVQDAELVASELTANSVEHGGGEGELCFWRDATHLIIEVSDAGHIDDPLAYISPVPPDSVGGRGCCSCTSSPTSSASTPAPAAPLSASTSPAR